MAKTRTTRHSGRAGKASHNDRQFDTTQAEHIDQDRMEDNGYWHCYSNNDLTFEQAEMKYYTEHYGQALEAQNARYDKSRHRERIRTIEDIYKAKNTQPIETIFQIGNKDNAGAGVDKETLVSIYNAYWDRVNAWNNEHGNHYHRLSVALHVDETTPHFHERAVWDIQTKDGLKLSQDKALEDAGVPLPDPSKPRGRYNNRKMTVDAIFRGYWIDACREHGIDIEAEPLPTRKHRGKEAYIDQQIADKVARSEILDNALAGAQERMEALQADISTLEAVEADIDERTQAKRADYRNTVDATREVREHLTELEETKAQLEPYLTAKKYNPEQELKSNWRGKVAMPADDYRRLARQAQFVEDARDALAHQKQYREIIAHKDAIYAKADKARREAQGILDDAKGQAEQIIRDAEIEANSRWLEDDPVEHKVSDLQSQVSKLKKELSSVKETLSLLTTYLRDEWGDHMILECFKDWVNLRGERARDLDHGGR